MDYQNFSFLKSNWFDDFRFRYFKIIIATFLFIIKYYTQIKKHSDSVTAIVKVIIYIELMYTIEQIILLVIAIIN